MKPFKQKKEKLCLLKNKSNVNGIFCLFQHATPQCPGTLTLELAMVSIPDCS